MDDVNEVLKKGTEKRSIPWRHKKLWGICIRNLHVIEETKLFCGILRHILYKDTYYRYIMHINLGNKNMTLVLIFLKPL